MDSFLLAFENALILNHFCFFWVEGAPRRVWQEKIHKKNKRFNFRVNVFAK